MTEPTTADPTTTVRADDIPGTDAIRFYERNGFAPQALTLRLSLGTGR